jgi:hypothetical protein
MNARTPSMIVSALVIAALAVTASLNIAAAPQAAQGPNDVMASLLSEVHALRVAMERSATATPRLQLTLARLNIEEQRTTQLGAQLEHVRHQISDSAAEIQKTSDDLAEYTRRLQTESSEPLKTAVERERAVLEQQLRHQNADQQQLRVQEAEAAQLFTAEQNRWTLLNARLDELEQLLGPVK